MEKRSCSYFPDSGLLTVNIVPVLQNILIYCPTFQIKLTQESFPMAIPVICFHENNLIYKCFIIESQHYDTIINGSGTMLFSYKTPLLNTMEIPKMYADNPSG